MVRISEIQKFSKFLETFAGNFHTNFPSVEKFKGIFEISGRMESAHAFSRIDGDSKHCSLNLPTGTSRAGRIKKST